eukprot:6213793-Pleurochrysis_carterae.AAC.2
MAAYAKGTHCQEAVPGATVHQAMKYTHDWKNFFDTAIYDSIANINTGREIIIRERNSDGGDSAAPMYPYPAHIR